VKAAIQPELAVEAFVASNLSFLGLDVGLAHAENGFRSIEEWIPIGLSVAATLVLWPGLFSSALRSRLRVLSLLVGAASIAVGVAGLIYHLRSAFFAEQTLQNLVYAAPFLAPLSFVGVGLLLILNRIESPRSPSYFTWISILALGGFVGNFGLSVLDHAENGFFAPAEWVPVAAAAFAVSFLLVSLLWPDDRMVTALSLIVLVFQALVGVGGFLLHASANLHRPGSNFGERLLYGAPAFAPLLFADLALLALIGLWPRLARTEPS
jgi:hypothetical protein